MHATLQGYRGLDYNDIHYLLLRLVTRSWNEATLTTYVHVHVHMYKKDLYMIIIIITVFSPQLLFPNVLQFSVDSLQFHAPWGPKVGVVNGWSLISTHPKSSGGTLSLRSLTSVLVSSSSPSIAVN